MSSYADAAEQDMNEMLGPDAPLSITSGGGSDKVNVVEVVKPQKRKGAPTKQEVNPKKPKAQENRAVYVTNIPRDATVEEIEDVFKKYGMIDQSVDGKPRIKMYTDEDGNFNGEALIIYFKKDSVALAIRLQDDYEFRLGDRANGTVHVQEADMSFKKNKDREDIATKLVRKERKAAEANRAKMNQKLADWSDNEEEVKEMYAPKKNKWSKIAIIKKAFELYQLEEDVAVLEIKEDMREAAAKFGEVTKVVLYDKEPEGILTVRFKDAKAAEAFRDNFNGKHYNNEHLVITIAEDRPKFKKSSKGEGSDSEDDATRLERFMSDGDSD